MPRTYVIIDLNGKEMVAPFPTTVARESSICLLKYNLTGACASALRNSVVIMIFFFHELLIKRVSKNVKSQRQIKFDLFTVQSLGVRQR